jgi:hypothetical protein
MTKPSVKELTRLTVNSIIEELVKSNLIHSVHVGVDRMYAVAIDRDVILLTHNEMKWFGIGLLMKEANYDSKKE